MVSLQVVVGRGRHGMTRVTGKTHGLDSNALRKVVEEVCRSVEVRLLTLSQLLPYLLCPIFRVSTVFLCREL